MIFRLGWEHEASRTGGLAQRWSVIDRFGSLSLEDTSQGQTMLSGGIIRRCVANGKQLCLSEWAN